MMRSLASYFGPGKPWNFAFFGRGNVCTNSLLFHHERAASSAHNRFVWLVAWRSGNALCRINQVALRRARLVLGWVTVYGQVKPSRSETSQLGLLNLLPSMGW